MKFKTLPVLAALAALTVGAAVSTTASAQSFGFGVGYHSWYGPAYRYHGPRYHRYVRVYEPAYVYAPAYYGPGPGYYGSGPGYAPADYCVQQRQHTGATVFGGLAGAAIGSNMAAHHGGRTGGALLGALAGAMIGHQIGVENSPPPAQCTARYDGPPPPGADRDYDERRADADESDRLPPPPRGDAGASTDGCRLADSPIHMPDGSTEQRYVRVCPDGNGRYRVVD